MCKSCSKTGNKNHMFGRVGNLNPNYNSKISDYDRELNRHGSSLYKSWRKLVFKRDNFTCIFCGDSDGGNLEAHHINSHDWCEELRLDKSNGITLCKDCHKIFHKKYGYGNNTVEQFVKFCYKGENK